LGGVLAFGFCKCLLVLVVAGSISGFGFIASVAYKTLKASAWSSLSPSIVESSLSSEDFNSEIFEPWEIISFLRTASSVVLAFAASRDCIRCSKFVTASPCKVKSPSKASNAFLSFSSRVETLVVRESITLLNLFGAILVGCWGTPMDGFGLGSNGQMY